ncbi:hypothetical protein HDU88_000629 [Geranomyces variabilis]|nr:hypothetical protein HDU88_000629 [Geranomyces variabilis]
MSDDESEYESPGRSYASSGDSDLDYALLPASAPAPDHVASAAADLVRLLQAHAAVLALDHPTANLRANFRAPLSPQELPAFSWVSIVYLCTKRRSWSVANEERHRLPAPVWDWIQELDAPNNIESAINSSALFADLRTVCLRWIAPVGLRRAASIWDAIFRGYHDRKFENEMTDEQLRSTPVIVHGPAANSFEYPEEVHLELDPLIKREKYPKERKKTVSSSAPAVVSVAVRNPEVQASAHHPMVLVIWLTTIPDAVTAEKWLFMLLAMHVSKPKKTPIIGRLSSAHTAAQCETPVQRSLVCRKLSCTRF